MRTPETKQGFSAGGRTRALWAGIVGVPVVWAVQQQLTYVLVPWACHRKDATPLLALTLAMLALVLAGGWVSHREWRRVGGGWPRDTSSDVDERTRFLGMLGMLASGLFALLVVAHGIATAMIDPCAQ